MYMVYQNAHNNKIYPLLPFPHPNKILLGRNILTYQKHMLRVHLNSYKYMRSKHGKPYLARFHCSSTNFSSIFNYNGNKVVRC